MIQSAIEGVEVKKLSPIPDERGWLMEILRCDDAMYTKFGQVYVTTIYPNVVKAWHYHRIQTDHFCVVAGMAKLVLYDAREASPTWGKTEEYFTGERNPLLIKIPPMVYHGFKGIGTRTTVVVNVPDEPYNRESPDEYRIDPYDAKIPYDWSLKEG